MGFWETRTPFFVPFGDGEASLKRMKRKMGQMTYWVGVLVCEDVYQGGFFNFENL